MFEKESGEECAFEVSLSVLEKLFLTKIRHTSSDQIGVIFYNTEKSPEPKADVQIACPAQCAILYVLQSIESDIIRYIKNTKASGDYHNFANKYGHSSQTPISEVLWLCHALASNSGLQVRNCSIVWFTNNDAPHPPNSTEFKDAMEKTNDLKSLHLDLQMVPLKDNFDGSLFYHEFMAHMMKDRDEIELPASSRDADDIAKRLFTRDYRNRALSYLTVEIFDKPHFGVGIYTFTSKKRETKPETISRVTKEIVRTKRSFKYGQMSAGGGDDEHNVSFNEKLSAEKAVKYLEVGGEKIKFTPLETYEMKQFMQPSIKILGFKPMSSYLSHNHKRSPYFVYPDERTIKHSYTTFRALWETCLSMNKFILCIASLRLKSYPRFFALIPQRENAKRTQFDGFRMEFLPYSGEIRDLSDYIPGKKEVSSDVIEAATKAISKLTINYDVTMFKNPAIANIYNKIERVEFSDDVEEWEDVSMPKVNEQDRRMGAFVDTLLEAFADVQDTSSKRKATDNPGGSTAKKVAADIDEGVLVDLCKQGNVKNVTVGMLRDYLKIKNVPGVAKLNKSQLIEKVVEMN
jgi:ATP-dependent DNA helicase 2 subunit 1